MTRIRALQFILMTSLVFFRAFPGGGTALAQDGDSGADLFVPTSAWLVGPASVQPIAESGFSMPCVMMNQYSNGFILRFSIGDDKVLAMAVDSHREAFKAGERFDVTVGISPSFSSDLSAEAYNGSTFLVNLQQVPGVYEALRDGTVMTLMIGKSPFRFALPGVQDGLERSRQCYGSAPSGPQAAPVSPAYESAMQEPLESPAPAVETPAEDVAAPVAQPGGAVAVLDGMLDNAAQKLANLAPAAGTAGRPYGMHNAEIIQKKPPAGVALAGTWTSPVAAKTEPQTQPLPPQQQHDIMVASTTDGTEAAGAESGERRWRAIKGTNLHEVLDVWARNASVRLIWKTEREFSVDESISFQGTFEDAARSILEQYGDDYVRPVGRIFIEPALRQKVLLVELNK